jgi:hypothetical protein
VLVLAHLALVHQTTGLADEARDTFDQALRLGIELGMHEDATELGDMMALAHAQGADHDPLETLGLYEQAMHGTLRPTRG